MFALKISDERKEQIIRTAAPMNEKQKRQYLAGEARLFGHGGISLISRITGVSRPTIIQGLKELDSGDLWERDSRIRSQGGGRKKAESEYGQLPEIIEKIIAESTYGTPSDIIKWTTLSLRKICRILKEKYHISVCHSTVQKIMKLLGYSRQANKKMEQVGKAAPDRNEQFEFIAAKAEEFIKAGDPVISVDTKKKENIGNFKNPGTEYRKIKDPRHVLDHDFPIPELGKVAPYGIYVLNDNVGFVNLGTSHDTAEFAVESILRWWLSLGREAFPNAERILITCDSGGSNSVNGRLWKQQLTEFSRMTGLEVHVSHFPAGASKWNKIEHRMFSYISKSWQGKPLIDIQTVIDLIGSTSTTSGLKITCVPDYNEYKLGQKISDKEFKNLPITYIESLSKRNYIIKAKVK